MIHRALLSPFLLVFACADKAPAGESGLSGETGETGVEESTYSCTGLADALGAIGERELGLDASFPDVECAGGIWTFEADAAHGDTVADEIWVMPWSVNTGAFGPATALTDDGTGDFSGTIPSSESGFSCDAQLETGWVFAPLAGGRLGNLTGMGGRGLANGAGWGNFGGGGYGFEMATEGEEVVSATAFACNPVSGVGVGPLEMSGMGPSEDYAGSLLWHVDLDLDASDLGDDDEVLLGALGVDAGGALIASTFGGG